MKKISPKAFEGLEKDIVIKVPAKKYKAYKKMIKACDLTVKVTIKKF